MIAVLTKPIEEIGIDDIQSLVVSEVREGQEIEFKESLPGGRKSSDPWMAGQDEIGDRAKDMVLKQATALANAYGGGLVLGVAESDTKPPVAVSVAPIPRCAELAERLKLVLRDGVEPQIPRVEVAAVPIEGDTGVLVIRVGRSRMAPHRVKRTRVCAVRRADRTEDMTMREIQDMTLNVSRGQERLEHRLSDRRERFVREFDRLETPGSAWGVRVTAMPVGQDLEIERLYGRHSVLPEFNEPWRTVVRGGAGRQHPLDLPIALNEWRPILRGARGESHYQQGVRRSARGYREIHCDGLVEVSLQFSAPTCTEAVPAPAHMPIALLANGIAQAHRLRSRDGAPMVEYGIEVEVRVVGKSGVPLTHEEFGWPRSGLLPVGATVFPCYFLGGVEGVPELLTQFDRDFWNDLGFGTEPDPDEFAIRDWPGEG